MKKVLMVLMAVTMVMGFAAMASAASSNAAVNGINCGGDPGNINRGCDEQDTCSPFDFENWSGKDYCNKEPNRAVFPVCECDPDFITNMSVRERYTVGMTIMVDKGTGTPVEGNSGVYWAEVVNSIPMGTYGTQGAACDTEAYPYNFAGPFLYMLANGDSTVKVNGVVENAIPSNVRNKCAVAEQNQVVEIMTNPTVATAGYQIQASDIIGQNSNWAIDIPAMRVDNTKTKPGWVVWVKVCISELASETGTICSECDSCCFMLKIGTLCCEDEIVAITNTLVFPYLTNTNGGWWNGMAVTNLDKADGTAAVTLYENGDVFTGTITVKANGITIIATDSLVLTTAGGDGIMGNERSYAKVVTSGFNASGFGMMAKESNGVSMGYLAEKY